MKFELLKVEDLRGDKRLRIFRRLSPQTVGTDVVNDSFKNLRGEIVPYWLGSFKEEFKQRQPWDFIAVPYVTGMCVQENVIKKYVPLSNTNGVRLKVAFDKIKDYIKCNQNGDVYVAEEYNDIKVLLALEWPQELVINKEEKEQLEAAKVTTKVFHISHDQKSNVVIFAENKYVKIEKKWYKVLPIEWYYDDYANLLVSKKVLFLSPMAYLENGSINSFRYDKSIVANFVNNIFAKEAAISGQEDL